MDNIISRKINLLCPQFFHFYAVAAISGTVDGLTNPQYRYGANGNMLRVSCCNKSPE